MRHKSCLQPPFVFFFIIIPAVQLRGLSLRIRDNAAAPLHVCAPAAAAGGGRALSMYLHVSVRGTKNPSCRFLRF